MLRYIIAIFIIYILVFNTGCQPKPASTVVDTALSVVREEKSQEYSGTAAYFKSSKQSPEFIINEDSESPLETDDLQLGMLKLKMTKQQAAQTMDAQPDKVMQEQNSTLEKRFYKDIELYIQNDEVIYISTTSDKYATPRGLRVGDSVESLLELYGTPTQIYNNIYSFALSGEYYLFHVEIKDGIIIRIQVNLAC